MSVRVDPQADRAQRVERRIWHAIERLRAELSVILDDEAARIGLWWPVGLACGVAAWFVIDGEPDWRFSTLIAAAGIACAAVLRRHGGLPFAAAMAVLAVAAGTTAMSLRNDWVSAPVIGERLAPATVEGHVIDVEARGASGVAIRIAPDLIGRLARDEIPAIVRVTMSAKSAALATAGDQVRLRAVLLPPPGPVSPGAHDFARSAWFDRLGGVGFAVSGIEVLGPAELGGVEGAKAALERLRAGITARIIAAAPGDAGAVAAALLTGKRGAIPEDTLAALRDSGLAHLLAISGLHMALVCGTVFGAVTFVLALFPWLALRITPAKWAAAFSLAAGFGYFLISGGAVATERAFIMVVISLCAVMIDRPAITMRNVAIAATVTLLLRPESLVEASFQMSFSAVIALVAFYDAVRRWRERRGPRERRARGVVRTIGLSIAAIAVTSIVAELAIGPIAAHHFNRVAVYGLAANLIAVPLTGMVIMPLGLAALALMPLGLESTPLAVMSEAIGWMQAAAHEVVSWEGSVRVVPSSPTLALIVYAAGGLWLCLWQRNWRLLGIAPIAASLVIASTAARPDLLVAREVQNIALRGADGRLSVARPRAASYSVENWLRRDGDDRTQREASPGEFRCDWSGCTATTAYGLEVAYIIRRDALAEDCGRADLIVATIPVFGRCGDATIIDLTDIRRRGTHSATFSPDGTIAIVDAQAMRGDKPWAVLGD